MTELNLIISVAWFPTYQMLWFHSMKFVVKEKIKFSPKQLSLRVLNHEIPIPCEEE